MPPKKGNADIVLLKFKRHASTYMVDVPKKTDLATLKARLVEIINGAGGLTIDDKPILPGELPADIPIPNVGVTESDSDSDSDLQAPGNDTNNESISTEINDSSKIQVKVEDITLGEFSQTTDIHSAKIEVIEMSEDTKIDHFKWQDFHPLAFKFQDEEFKIYRPQYE